MERCDTTNGEAGTDPCQIWDGAVGTQGYGVNRGGYAHRLAYETAFGSIPAGQIVHHSCEVKLCINPQHLTLMSRADHAAHHHPRTGNVCPQGHQRPPGSRCPQCHRDDEKRRRTPAMQKRAAALAERVECVRAGLAAGLTHQAIADSMDVSRVTVTRIANGTLKYA